MDTRTYPGKGLSLSQLVFALNEELKRAAYSPSYVAKDRCGLACEVPRNDALTRFTYSYTFNNVSQLDQDTSIALTAIREWRNSFIHINRVPLDVLSLVPTHLHSQQDRFRASFVCRHWRRVFLQHATLWSQLFLSKGEVYVKTLLERTKGSALDIIASHNNPVDAVVLLPPHTQQIRHLSFVSIPWVDIQMFSVTNPGPFPVLRTLTIETAIDTDTDGFSLMAPPSLPLFSNAVDLKEFVLRSEGSPFLNHFAFPNLTTFELLGAPVEGFRASELLDFLEASPTLRTVQMKIISGILLGDVSRERMVVLPNVETFSLAMDYGGPGYELATYISCPSVGQTSFMHEIIADHILPQQMFPSSVSWNAIVRQYTRDLIEEVTFRVEFSHIVTCSLVFRSPATVIRLDFNVSESDEEEVLVPYRVLFYQVFSQALGPSGITHRCPTSSVSTLIIGLVSWITDSNILQTRSEDCSSLWVLWTS